MTLWIAIVIWIGLEIDFTNGLDQIGTFGASFSWFRKIRSRIVPSYPRVRIRFISHIYVKEEGGERGGLAAIIYSISFNIYLSNLKITAF